MRTRGFTLAEMLIVAVVLAILAGIALPQYRRTIERGYWRTAQNVLQAIYAGEQVYQAAEDVYVDAGACVPAWRCVYMDDPNLSPEPVTYAVTSVTIGPPPRFTATAARGDGRCMSIDEQRTLTFSSAGAPGCSAGWTIP